MIYSVLVIAAIVVAILLTFVVLIQESKGGWFGFKLCRFEPDYGCSQNN